MPIRYDSQTRPGLKSLWKPASKNVKRVARGDRAHNVRARIPQGQPCESVAQQVDCLIDLATDPNVLARQWFGLATWV